MTLHGLACAAGVMATPEMQTAQGFEYQLGEDDVPHAEDAMPVWSTAHDPPTSCCVWYAVQA